MLWKRENMSLLRSLNGIRKLYKYNLVNSELPELIQVNLYLSKSRRS